MVISSLYPILVHTDHEALRVLLTGLDNDAHGRLAKWQERLGEYDFRLLHRVASTHFMGIADGLSRLPSQLMQRPFAEISDDLHPKPSIITCGQLIFDILVPVNSQPAANWRRGGTIRGLDGGGNGGGGTGKEERRAGVEIASSGVVENGDDGGASQRLGAAAMDLKRRKWRRWIDSEFYGSIVMVKSYGREAGEEMDLGKSGWQALERRARRFWMVEGREPRLYWKEGDG